MSMPPLAFFPRALTASARIFRVLTGLAFMLWTVQTASAHPHVWVDYHVQAHFDQNGLAGFHHRWHFDEMFSSQVMGMFDEDGDGVFSSGEVEAVRQGAFAYLEEYDYFIQIKVDGQTRVVREVQDFHARIEGHEVVYEFFTPLPVAADTNVTTVHLLLADMEYFVDMAFVSDGMTILGREHVNVEVSFGSGPPFSFWGGAWQPEHFTLRFKKPQ